VNVEEGRGQPRPGRSRSRDRFTASGRCRHASRSTRTPVDQDHFVVPPKPIKFPATFTTFAESAGRKGIKKYRTSAAGRKNN